MTMLQIVVSLIVQANLLDKMRECKFLKEDSNYIEIIPSFESLGRA
jgi:hypothetical protein